MLEAAGTPRSCKQNTHLRKCEQSANLRRHGDLSLLRRRLALSGSTLREDALFLFTASRVPYGLHIEKGNVMHVLSLLASLLISATPATPQAAPIFVPLQTPPTCSSYGVKINVHGNAVFNVLCPNAPTSAAYYFSAAGGTVIRLGIARGAMATVGFDIDDENFVVGTTIFNQNGAKRYPTIWSPSGRENVLPEPTSTEARGISPSPQGAIIVGQTGIGTILPQARIVPLPLLVVPPRPRREIPVH